MATARSRSVRVIRSGVTPRPVWCRKSSGAGGASRTSASATAIAAAVYLLSLATKTLPVGTAYAVFTGIAAVGGVVLARVTA